MVIESVIRMLYKPLWGELRILGLYWFTQPKQRLVLLYSLVKGLTNQNLTTKQVF